MGQISRFGLVVMALLGWHPVPVEDEMRRRGVELERKNRKLMIMGNSWLMYSVRRRGFYFVQQDVAVIIRGQKL